MAEDAAQRVARTIYFDHGATSFPKPPAVVDAVTSALTDFGGNPGRGAYALAMATARLVRDARRDVGALLGVPGARDVLFSPSCTEALNLVLKGLLRPGDRVVVSAVEHNAVVRPLHRLKQAGVDVAVVGADSNGQVDPDDVELAVKKAPTRLVCVQHASNLTGAVQAVGDMADIAHEAGALFVVDGAQAGGHLDVDLSTLGADAWACAGHKGLLGPMGAGVLYLAPGCDPLPLVEGGTGSGASESAEMPDARPDRYEAGTAAVPAIAGLGAAARFLAEHGPAQRAEEQRLARRLHEGALERGFRVLGPPPAAPRVPIVSMVHPDVEADRIAFELDRRWGIAVRAGLHCTPWAHVAVGTLDCGAVRFGCGFGTTDDGVDTALAALEAIVG